MTRIDSATVPTTGSFLVTGSHTAVHVCWAGTPGVTPLALTFYHLDFATEPDELDLWGGHRKALTIPPAAVAGLAGALAAAATCVASAAG